MHRLSMVQALSLWRTLEDAFIEERDIDGLANIVFRAVDGKVRVYAATSKA